MNEKRRRNRREKSIVKYDGISIKSKINDGIYLLFILII
jgi:hypothetical protein